ncbi:MAG: hypothetical protein ACLTMP_00270 [Eggerthella lenta]
MLGRGARVGRPRGGRAGRVRRRGGQQASQLRGPHQGDLAVSANKRGA